MRGVVRGEIAHEGYGAEGGAVALGAAPGGCEGGAVDVEFGFAEAAEVVEGAGGVGCALEGGLEGGVGGKNGF